MYNLSKYNVIFNRGNNMYLWNTFSGTLIGLTDEGLNYISNFNEHSDIYSDYFKLLYSNGCIVNMELDELGRVLYDEQVITFEQYPSRIYYTIAPGLGCNYNCKYCFENHRESFDKMTNEMQDAIINYIKNQVIKNKNLERISITWFGGEPLLYADIIDYMSSKLIEFCDSNGIQYYSGIISNGRFLTKENTKMLKKNRIGHVQISIDGLKDYYIIQKQATSFDFEQTISNIVDASNYLPIAVRINVGDSIDSAIALTEYLLKGRGLDGKIKIYIAHTRNYDNSYTASEEQSAHGKFLDMEAQYISLFGKGGIYSKKSFEYRIPRRRGASCLSSCCTNSCIGPKGEFYQCEHHYGIKQHIIGSIKDGFYNGENKRKYLQFNHHKKCLHCQFFPICLGGCIDDRVNNRKMINCNKYKKRLIDLIMYEIEH